MKKEDSLHLLIHSLDSSEKRLFKIYVSNNSKAKNSQYIELFDVLSKLKEYDEVKLKKKITHANTKKNLAQAKKYLKDLILKAMREIDDESAADKVNNLLKEASFLSKKNLFKEQWKKLEKAKQIADKYELYAEALEILDLKMKYLIEHNFSESERYKKVYENEKNKLIKCYNVYNDLILIKNKYFQQIRKNRTNIDKNLKLSFKEKIESIDVFSHNSFRINIVYYNLAAIYFDLINEKSKIEHYRFEKLSAYENNKQYIKENYADYLIANFNYLSALFKQGKFDQLREKLGALEKLKLPSHNLKGEYFQGFALYKILLFLNTNSLQEALNFEQYLIDGIIKFREKINSSFLYSLYYNYTLVFFLNSSYQKALEWLYKIDEENFKVKSDRKNFIKILAFICHFELENNSILDSMTRSLKRSHNLNSYEQFVFGHLNNIALASTFERKIEAKLFLERLNEKIEQKNIEIGIYTIQHWAKSKV